MSDAGNGGGSLRDKLPELWQPHQRRVLIGFLIVLALLITLVYALHPTYVSDPQPLVPSRAGELADRIDPNTATQSELAALPLLGERRARDIIAYRERYAADFPGQPAFARVEDLLKIRGIGASVIEQLRPYLIFPSATSQSATDRAR